MSLQSIRLYQLQLSLPLDAEDEGLSRVYTASIGTSVQNIQNTIEIMGGIEKFISSQDIVILKPHAQWWNQGMTNTDAMRGFTRSKTEHHGFSRG